MKIHALLPLFACIILAAVSCRKADTDDSAAGAAKPAGGSVEKAKAISVTVKAGDQSVMKMTVPDGTTVSYDGPKVIINGTEWSQRFFIWKVSDGENLAPATAQVPTLIQSEFKNFTVTSTTDTTVGPLKGLQLKGTGVEADDGDPGTAEVILFVFNNQVFAACAHGEEMPPARVDFMITSLSTITRP